MFNVVAMNNPAVPAIMVPVAMACMEARSKV